MILLDKPFVSDYLRDTILRNKIPVVHTEYYSQLDNVENLYSLSTNSAVRKLKKQTHPLLYTNSENSIEWMMKYLQFTDIPDKINKKVSMVFMD